MEILVAIDIINGEAVRLFQGDYEKKTVYGENPVEIAKEFKSKGATHLHIVDLDGARAGTLANYDTIAEIVKLGGLFVEVGGGIRDEERIIRYLELGVSRIILGTAAALNRSFLQDMVDKYGQRIAVGVDVKDGMVAIKGWKEITNIDGITFCRELQSIGVKTVIYTDISKDGMLEGTNMDIYKELATIDGLEVVASGGISSLDELAQLKGTVTAAIVGKAIYTGMIDIENALKITNTKAEDQMISKKIIACLDIKGGRVVKGKNFEGIKEVADPVEMARFYSEEGVDELVFYDITASVEKRSIFTDLLKQVKAQTSVPLIVGGGIKSLEDIESAIKYGAAKVSINSGAIENPELLNEGARKYGKQRIILSMDVKRVNGEFRVFTRGGMEDTGIDALKWAEEGEKRGAGELVINSIDTDGVKEGFDIEMLLGIASRVQIPIIASGGAGKEEDFAEIFKYPEIAAGLAAGVFHSKEVRIPSLKEYLKQNNI